MGKMVVNGLFKGHGDFYPALSCFSCYLLHSGFLLGLIFYPEDDDDVFFRNVIDFQQPT
jgi:hypothetical protein